MRASMRGRTRNSMGEIPMVIKASTSSFTCMVPIWAAKAAPVRPAMMIPVMRAAISRAMAIPTRFATKICAPNIRSCTAPTKARIRPTRKLMSEIISYVKEVTPKLKHKIEYYKAKNPIFEAYNIEKEITRSMESRVWLKNGAYIVIEQTEAMFSIDVNSGKFIGKKDHETNSLKINLEAAREIARQARLRDIGGLIVIDFIDVLQEDNKRKIFQELKREFYKDRSITKIEDMSRFGLIEMTRQRIRPSILHSLHEECPQCKGTGLVPSLNTIVADMERWIQCYRSQGGDRRITLRVTAEIHNYVMQGRFSRRLQLMWKYWMKINFIKDDNLQYREYKVYDQRNVVDNDFDEGEDYIGEDKFHELRDFEIFPLDILITTRGTIGKCAVFPKDKFRGILHPCLIRIQSAQ